MATSDSGDHGWAVLGPYTWFYVAGAVILVVGLTSYRETHSGTHGVSGPSASAAANNAALKALTSIPSVGHGLAQGPSATTDTALARLWDSPIQGTNYLADRVTHAYTDATGFHPAGSLVGAKGLEVNRATIIETGSVFGRPFLGMPFPTNPEYTGPASLG